jgi:hypothetical protein
MRLSKKAKWRIEHAAWLEARRLLKRDMREAAKEADAAGRAYCRMKMRANGVIVWRRAPRAGLLSAKSLAGASYINTGSSWNRVGDF